MSNASFPGWAGPPVGAVVALGIGFVRSASDGPGISVPWLAVWAGVGFSAGCVVWLADSSVRRQQLRGNASRGWRPAVSSPAARAGLWFGLILSLTVGPFIAFLGAEKFATSWRMSQWPTTDAVILESYVRESSHTNLDVTTESYSPVVRYWYEAAGAEQEGRSVGQAPLNVTYSDRSKADSIVARHPQGAVRPVYYDPDNPDRAVLEPRMAWTEALLFFVVPVVALGIAAIIFVCLRAEEDECNS